MTAEEVADDRLAVDYPLYARANHHSKPSDEFRAGTLRKWHLRFTYAPGISIDRDLVDVDFDPTSKPMTYSQLPEGFRDQVEAAYKQRVAIAKGDRPPSTAKPPP